MSIGKVLTDEQWIEAIKSSYSNNSQVYTTVHWMHLETNMPTKKVMYNLNKLVKSGLLIKITSNKGVWYKILNKQS